jgi:hypothetical protein
LSILESSIDKFEQLKLLWNIKSWYLI